MWVTKIRAILLMASFLHRASSKRCCVPSPASTIHSLESSLTTSELTFRVAHGRPAAVPRKVTLRVSTGMAGLGLA
jgi:hypothetical protein